MKTLIAKIKKRLCYYIIRVNQYVLFNKIRIFVYQSILGMDVGIDTMIWCGNKFSINPEKKFIVGSNSIIGPNNIFLIGGGMIVGNNVNLSGFSYFITQWHDVDDPSYESKFKEIIIDDNAWVATNCTIMPGVRIGEGAVVAAGSVVTKDVPPYSVVGGNPAKFIKKRNCEIKYKLNSMNGTKWL